MSLFNVAFARQQNGQFVLRIEDTDRARYSGTSEQQILELLHWLGLDWDEGPDVGGPFAPYRQSERLDTYRPYVEQLLAAGHAYYCWCTPERLTQMREEQQRRKQPPGYDRMCLGKTYEQRALLPGCSETPVVRMLVPDDPPLTFPDLIRGEAHAPMPDDQVLLKTDGFPTYHLAVVVDDHLMQITHVVRGEEWISSTPKHLLLYDWLGWPRPAYAHMPLLRNADRSKISKRKNPAARLSWFHDEGYLPEALRNFLALMGYSQPDGAEVFTFEEMIAAFDWARVNPVGPVFDLEKLAWLNGHYIRLLPTAELTRRLLPVMQTAGLIGDLPTAEHNALLAAATPLVQERMEKLNDAVALLRFLFVSDDEFMVDPSAAAKAFAGDGARMLAAAREGLADVEWNREAIEATLRGLLAELGLKPRQGLAAVRVAVTGSTISPPLFESIELLGRDRTLSRLAAAAESARVPST